MYFEAIASDKTHMLKQVYFIFSKIRSRFAGQTVYCQAFALFGIAVAGICVTTAPGAAANRAETPAQTGAGSAQKPSSTMLPVKSPALESHVLQRPNCYADSVRDEAKIAENSATIQTILQSLWRYQRQRRSADAPIVSFTVSDDSVDDYLVYSLKAQPRPGIRAMKVVFHDHNRFSACVVLNPLDFVPVLGTALEQFGAKAKDADAKLVLDVDASFQVADGAVLIKLESAHIGNGPDLSRIVALAAAMQPEAYNLNKPIPTPFGLATLTTEDRTVTGSTVAAPTVKQRTAWGAAPGPQGR
jgi:hypothetical protein